MMIDGHVPATHIAAMETMILEFLIPQPGFMGPLFTVLVLALVLDAVCGDFLGCSGGCRIRWSGLAI